MVSVVQFVCVWAALAVVNVNARGFREVRHYGPGGPEMDDCLMAVFDCQGIAMQHYGHLVEQLEGPPLDAEAVITSELKGQPLTTHCSKLDDIAKCLINALKTSECSSSIYSTYLPNIQGAKEVLNEICEPENIKLVSKHINCFTNPRFYNAVAEECPDVVYKFLLQNFPDSRYRRFDAACSVVREKAGLATGHCVQLYMDVVGSCFDASGVNDPIGSLAFRMTQKLIKVILPEQELGCIPSQAAGQRMSLTKKFLGDIGLGFF